MSLTVEIVLYPPPLLYVWQVEACLSWLKERAGGGRAKLTDGAMSEGFFHNF